MRESDYIELGNLVYDDREIGPAQLGVTSRQINYWIDKALVPFVEKQQPKEDVLNKMDSLIAGKNDTKTK